MFTKKTKIIIHLLKLFPDTDKKLKQKIKVHLLKLPNADMKDLRDFLRTGSTAPVIAPYKKCSFSLFLKDNISKFRETGSCLKYRGIGNNNSLAKDRNSQNQQ